MKTLPLLISPVSIAIPTNFDGIYLDLDTGTTSTSEFPGWAYQSIPGTAILVPEPSTYATNVRPFLRPTLEGCDT